MIERQCAIEVIELGLEAISKLSRVLHAIHGHCTDEEYELLKRGIGLSIGKIQTEILDFIYVAYPDLDDLK